MYTSIKIFKSCPFSFSSSIHLIKFRKYCNHVKEQGETHFGFQTIPVNEKNEKVHEVFKDVADKYDMMNDAMSLGIHRYWKDVLIETLNPVAPIQLLDMAGGTGDIAFRYIKFLNNTSNVYDGPKESSVTICDINNHMLEVGKKRAEVFNVNNNNICKVEWVCGNAEELPFDDNQFSAYTISFGIRNVTNIHKAIQEAYRVLKPGGRFLCLEFSHLENKNLQWLYDQYSFQVIPPMGQILSGRWEHYQYLVESIRKFPNQKNFCEMIKKAGFLNVSYSNLTFGVAAIHSGYKL